MTSSRGEELRLRRQFHELRDREHGDAPAYREVMARTRVRAARTPWRAGWQTGAVAAAVVALSLLLARQHQREPGAVAARSSASPLGVSLPAWASPTASLLHAPGSDQLRTLPDLRASLVDRAISSIRTEDSGS
jgi:hypothetical protein